MRRPNLTSDIKPVSEFRANAAELIEQIRNTGRPLVLTQRGHSAAVVLNVEEYESLLEELDLLRDIRISEKQIKSGKGVSNREAKAQIRARVNR
ncbi:MAG: type II toxin-antitoxin system Phd/YefM family antitoxin [Thermoanaerobaculia bacterium]